MTDFRYRRPCFPQAHCQIKKTSCLYKSLCVVKQSATILETLSTVPTRNTSLHCALQTSTQSNTNPKISPNYFIVASNNLFFSNAELMASYTSVVPHWSHKLIGKIYTVSSQLPSQEIFRFYMEPTMRTFSITFNRLSNYNSIFSILCHCFFNSFRLVSLKWHII